MFVLKSEVTGVVIESLDDTPVQITFETAEEAESWKWNLIETGTEYEYRIISAFKPIKTFLA